MIFSALGGLFDRGLKLLERGEVKQANLFKNMIEPVHEVFNKFRAEHLATFRTVREMVRDPKVNLERAVQLVEDREVDESGSWARFAQLTELGSSIRNWDRDGRYAEYFACLEKCLMEVSLDHDARSIVFYATLKGGLKRTLREALQSGKESVSSRRQLADEVNRIVLLFNQYCAEVETSYLILKQRSLG